MAMVDTQSNFDLEVLLGAGGTVHFTKGLSDEEKSTDHVIKNIFGKVGAGDFAAPYVSAGL